MTDTAIQHQHDQLKEQQQDNALITDGSIITIRSNHSSIADAYSDDADYDSLDTIAEQQQQNEKDVIATSIPTANQQQQQRRRRALTVTQNNRPGDTDEAKPVATNNESTQSGEGQQPTATVTEAFDDLNLHDQIHELDDTIIDGNQHLSDSDYDDDDDDDLVSGHKRHQSHRSTMSSIHSYVSSASNYDLLLARLGSKDTTSSTSTSTLDTPTQEIRNSFDRVYNDAVSKGEEDEIDWEFWSKVISDFNSVAKSEPKVLSYNIQRGIPPTLRGMIWQLFAKSKNVKLEEQYMQLLKEESVYEKAIARDLPKASFMNHEYFAVQDGQEALFNVVKAYSLYDTEVGYSQGLLHITGPLLLNMPEEEAFCVIVQLMNKYDLRGHFLPQSDLLSQRLYQLEGLVADHLPHIQRHFQAHGVRSNMYAYQWFSTLFAYKFPLDTVFRIYDMIFAEGIETLHRFSVALLERNQSTILSLEFDDLVNFLKSDLLEIYMENANQLVKDAFQIHIVSKRLDRLAKDYQVESARANNEAEAIEALKRQNKALADSIKKMDMEYSELNKEHTEVATELITAKMDIARIHDENEALRQQSNDLKKALETLPAEVETRVKEEMEILYTKNAALVERNSALEDQLAYMENMIIEIKEKYSESENEREGLRQRLTDLKRLMG
ncbi:rab-GTPase-TBC domain-containing protein [Mucor lusitanicus]|uniref:Rab-GTPase-TBC domain-containing protein n=1 Tax=Mucor circinelloides f. lusitanicus TaxID=29924 RepID=A0A8H4EY60_MUCCL|nr:rab-GTPase-TBC domain-containing protein [Mucor lusitanicus]